ncbi:putative rho gtpase activator [Phaeomoniella chlamydospora]|uniref:Putative rho gtpase activator n=1 Tax=Phaeomoniella chlamydospora TaxID=158046 RepID=A0A0G2HI67_PHACM|nr:putative rho gtpase activator [Phaeomoniella chlamydospora]
MNGATSPTITAIPQYPPSPKSSLKHGREPSKSFFSNLMATKSAQRLESPERNGDEHSENGPKSRTSSKERNNYTRHTRGSTTDLTKMTPRSETVPTEPQDEAARSHSIAHGISSENSSSRRPNRKFGGLLQRTRSIKVDESPIPKPKGSPPHKMNLQRQDSGMNSEFREPLRTAPPKPTSRSGKEPPKPSAGRTRSADRHETDKKDKSSNLSSSLRDGAGAQLLSNLSNLSQSSKDTADRIGKVGKGFFSKITRSGSTNERDLTPTTVTDDNYQCSVINLPLVKQTRRTRIARRLELSKDKTEFWMPALPWRCIDYLNMNGCEEEGLYRIPGSGKEVRHWQRRFDMEHDINLFDEPELYDINIIGSMFKAWLRDLPDEILPKHTQNIIAEQCMGATKTPQLLKDELSKLPPFNYYLLFAITCHLSLLHSFSDKNKMDYRNLCICFQPCLKIDGFCFQFLVQDWKNCWQGCWTEKDYLEEEYRWEREGGHTSDEQSDRAVSSSDSAQLPQNDYEVDFNSHNTNGNGNRGQNRPVLPPTQSQTQTQSKQLLPEVQIGAPLSPIRIP